MMNYRGPFLLLLVGTVVSLAGAQCTRNEYFDTQIIVEHEILTQRFEDASELQILADTFKDIYNTMNAPRETEEVCDETFLRAVDSVQVEPMKMLYKQYDGQTGYFRQFLYKTHGLCVDCAADSSLFAKGKGRSGSELSQLVQSDASNCQCSASLTEENTRGPTEAEFKKAFKTTIREMFAPDGSAPLQNAEDTERVLEVEGGSCTLPDETFNADVIVELNVLPNDNDRKAVENAFVNGYNYLGPKYCDPDQHTLTSATLHDTPTTRRNLRNLRGDRFLSGTIRGSCGRGCGSGSGAYDDGRGRHLEEKEARRLWQAAGCYCSIYPMGYRRPTIDEFAVQFNKTLSFAHSNGFLSEPIHVLSVSHDSFTATAVQEVED